MYGLTKISLERNDLWPGSGRDAASWGVDPGGRVRRSAIRNGLPLGVGVDDRPAGAGRTPTGRATLQPRVPTSKERPWRPA
ncbi:hypothetical protein GCM10010521_36240 [Streptomyces rameus]|uniref:Uncharacterized protein n=1 Tax=Streptomyces rameus TaxID=68261 RepID=A0ABP6NJM9_9ACTN